jgi:hypothetical protein
MNMNTKEERVGSYKGDKPTYLHKPFLFVTIIVKPVSGGVSYLRLNHYSKSGFIL